MNLWDGNTWDHRVWNTVLAACLLVMVAVCVIAIANGGMLGVVFTLVMGPGFIFMARRGWRRG